MIKLKCCLCFNELSDVEIFENSTYHNAEKLCNKCNDELTIINNNTKHEKN